MDEHIEKLKRYIENKDEEGLKTELDKIQIAIEYSKLPQKQRDLVKAIMIEMTANHNRQDN